MFKTHEVDINDWHYRVVCKLCRFHKPFEHEPNKYDMQILYCKECHNPYPNDWGYGIYKLISTSTWYNPLSWGKTRWLNKLVEEEA